ncbi:Homeobox-leucine zipper protein hdg5 [Rhynchospora pubera]|uniref:Homeobox-leucine zipper protein hdg5 n=1 Tax=Rhynchospora pubera TaxID=906938 RepID=A0AAV8GG06_9POAL|nr:Homeobox-leucine zipper protein hdg5 [Rhynchospora pubera]
MYGDCQVLPTTDMTSSDSLFSTQMQSSGLGYLHSMPFHAFPSLLPKEEDLPSVVATESAKEDEMSGGSGSGNVDGFCSFGEEEEKDQKQQLQLPQDQQLQSQSPQPGDKRKKRYHRHTAHQIQEMESLFKECPHPDDKQRLKLSRDLGLSPRQVKFWFQNRRTQMKAQQDRADNSILRAENDSLKNENFRLQAAIRNVACPNCGGPAVLGEVSFDEQHLRIENARLKDELERLTCIASRYTGRPLIQPLGPSMPLILPQLDLDMSIYPRQFDQQGMMNGCNTGLMMPNPSITLGHTMAFMGPVISDQDKPLILELAGTAANELISLCHHNCPLWVHREGAESTQVIDIEEYKKAFRWPIDEKQHDVAMYTEATRDSTVVIMNSITLVDAFLDANKWVDLFPSIVSHAKTVQVISPGLSGHASGSVILMHAELQFPSPLVPAREYVFFRYCQQNLQEGTWTIVDFPADGFDNNYAVTTTMKNKRRPSGCIIQDMPNGYASITWVEHCEVEDKPLNPTFSKFVRSGSAFGANRWVSLLQRQCERLASLMARNVSELGVISSLEGRKNMMTLSQRMIKTFCANVSASATQSWTALSESPEDTIRVTTRKCTEPGQPNGMILTAVSTSWLPVNHLQVFELLTDEQRRSQIDILSSGNSLQEVAHIANGSHPRNCVSLLRINQAASNSSQNVGLLIQESSTHLQGGGLVVYAAVEVDAVKAVMNGEDTSFIPLLPSGFVISPAASTTVGLISGDQAGHSTSTVGCLLTVGTQVLVSADLSSKISLTSVTAINNHICNTVQQISTALGVAPRADRGSMGPTP